MRLIFGFLILASVLTSCFDKQDSSNGDTEQYQNLEFANQPKIDTSMSVSYTI